MRTRSKILLMTQALLFSFALTSCGGESSTSSSSLDNSSSPTNIMLTPDYTQIQVDWQNATETNSYVRVQYKETASNSDYIIAATLSDQITYTIKGLKSGIAYSIRLQNLNGDDNASAYSTVVATATKQVPFVKTITPTMATGNDTFVQWGWNEVTDWQIIKTYTVQRSDAGGAWTDVGSVTPVGYLPISTMLDSSAPQNISFLYRMLVTYKTDPEISTSAIMADPVLMDCSSTCILVLQL